MQDHYLKNSKLRKQKYTCTNALKILFMPGVITLTHALFYESNTSGVNNFLKRP